MDRSRAHPLLADLPEVIHLPARVDRNPVLVGRPPLAYLTWWRMTVAAAALRDGDAPLASVARRVGYVSEFAFAHAFKREYGTAPGAYRRGFINS
jgi:AraC-like DNA-binding protein